MDSILLYDEVKEVVFIRPTRDGGTMVIQKLKPGEERKQVVDGWIDRYGERVYRTALAFHADVARAEDAFVHTFTLAYRRYDDLARLSDESLCILTATLWSCEETPVDGLHVADVSRPNGEEQPSTDEQHTASCAPEGSSHTYLLNDIAALDVPLRSALLAALWGDLDWMGLTGVLLTPRKIIQQRVDQALQNLTELRSGRELRSDSAVLTLESVRTTLDEFFCVSVPDWLRNRASKQVKATLAQFHAERRHRGPRMWMLATSVTTLLGLLAVGFGVERAHPIQSVSHNAGQTSEAVDGLPIPLQNLPGNVLAQYELPSNFSVQDLSHMAIGSDAIYLSSLEQAADAWPKIQLEAYKFADTGQSLANADKSTIEVSTVLPSSSELSAKPNWKIQDWHVEVGRPWAVLLVHWQDAANKSAAVTQVYALYLPTGQSSLVNTIDSQNQGENSVIAAGGDKVIVQKSIYGKSQTESGSPIGLPVDVYSLQGTQPLRALTGPTEMAAPFGMMVNPSITGGVLTFQGIAGQPDDASATNGTWYTLSWDGQLSRYQGAPLDGRPHWAIRGTTGRLWWCETTPDPANNSHLQVLMAPMEDVSAEQPASTETLSGSVSFFTVSGQCVAWVQTTKNVMQLVVEAIE